MKKLIPIFTSLAMMPATVNAGLFYDQDVTPDIIFGSGNENGGFTVDRNDDVELGLRAKLRYNNAGNPENTFNSNGDGTYSFEAGSALGQSSSTPVWSFEWSINTSFSGETGRVLNDLTYELGIDYDPGTGTDFVTFDPLDIIWADNVFGDNATGNGGGTVSSIWDIFGTPLYILMGENNVAQNSWQSDTFSFLGFAKGFDSFDPTVDGTYDFFLSASDGENNELARTSMQVLVGNVGTATVPVPAPLALFGLGLLAFSVSRRVRNAR